MFNVLYLIVLYLIVSARDELNFWRQGEMKWTAHGRLYWYIYIICIIYRPCILCSTHIICHLMSVQIVCFLCHKLVLFTFNFCVYSLLHVVHYFVMNIMLVLAIIECKQHRKFPLWKCVTKWIGQPITRLVPWVIQVSQGLSKVCLGFGYIRGMKPLSCWVALTVSSCDLYSRS